MPHAKPEDLLIGFAAAWNAGDADALGELFAEDAEFVNVVGLWWHCRRDIVRAHRYAFRRFFKDTRLSLKETLVKLLDEDVATVHGRWELKGQTAPDGLPADARRGIMTFVAQRCANGWHIASAQNTDIVPGAETQVVRDGGLAPVTYRN